MIIKKRLVETGLRCEIKTHHAVSIEEFQNELSSALEKLGAIGDSQGSPSMLQFSTGCSSVEAEVCRWETDQEYVQRIKDTRKGYETELGIVAGSNMSEEGKSARVADIVRYLADLPDVDNVEDVAGAQVEMSSAYSTAVDIKIVSFDNDQGASLPDLLEKIESTQSELVSQGALPSLITLSFNGFYDDDEAYVSIGGSRWIGDLEASELGY